MSPSKPINEIEQLEDRIRAAERWMIWLTAAIAFFALCSVIVGALQWNAMKGQLKEMKSSGGQTDKLIQESTAQATATNDLASQAKRSASAAEGALASSREQFQMDERPYVLPTKLRPEENSVLAAGSKMLWRVEYKNFGKSPAVEFVSTGQLFWGKNATQRANKWFSRTGVCFPIEGSRSLEPPNSPVPSYSTFQSFDGLSADDVSYILTHDAGVVIVGQFQYADMYGNLYATDFCYLRLGTGAMAFCHEHNEIREITKSGRWPNCKKTGLPS